MVMFIHFEVQVILRRTSYIHWNAFFFGRTWKFKTTNNVDRICKRSWTM